MSSMNFAVRSRPFNVPPTSSDGFDSQGSTLVPCDPSETVTDERCGGQVWMVSIGTVEGQDLYKEVHVHRIEDVPARTVNTAIPLTTAAAVEKVSRILNKDYRLDSAYINTTDLGNSIARVWRAHTGMETVPSLTLDLEVGHKNGRFNRSVPLKQSGLWCSDIARSISQYLKDEITEWEYIPETMGPARELREHGHLEGSIKDELTGTEKTLMLQKLYCGYIEEIGSKIKEGTDSEVWGKTEGWKDVPLLDYSRGRQSRDNDGDSQMTG